MPEQKCYVGIDVSLEQTSICVIDDAGAVVWRGKCRSTADRIAAVVGKHARGVGRIGSETGLLLEAAVESYRKAVSLTPAQPLVWNDLGRALRALGRFDVTTAAFREALKADPEFSDAYRNLARCQQLVDDERTISRLAALAARHDLSIDERAAAGFALGKVLDDAGRFDEAFTAYERTNRLYRSSRSAVGERFDAERLHSEVDKAMNCFTPTFFASVADWGSPSEVPVFVLGMPRSGTSLVEQIAASHSQVFGGGELRDIGDLTAAISRNLPRASSSFLTTS